MKEARHKLWKFFSDEHELTLTEGQLTDIVREVETYQKYINKICNTFDYNKCNRKYKQIGEFGINQGVCMNLTHKLECEHGDKKCEAKI